MTLFDDILTQFPPEVQATVRKVWDALGPNEKAGFLSLLVGFPADTNMAKLLVKLSTAQIRQAFGNKHQVVIVGPTNVGKSTLLSHPSQDDYFLSKEILWLKSHVKMRSSTIT